MVNLKRKASFINPEVDVAKKEIVPRALDVEVMTAGALTFRPTTLPLIVKQQLASPSLILSVGIQTHDWLDIPKENKKKHSGQFGWYAMDPPEQLRYQRIVELGWVVGAIDSNKTVVKTRLVQPNGFCISDEARAFHGISNEDIIRNGMDLINVLEEFMADVKTACATNGRICAHKFEFAGGIILEELSRCGLLHLRKEWMSVATNKSYCTMNPNAGRWIIECSGADVGALTKQHALELNALLEISDFIPTEGSRFLRNKIERRRAQFDAEISRLVYVTLLKHAGAPVNAIGPSDAQVCDEDDTQEYDAAATVAVDDCCEETMVSNDPKTARMKWELRFVKTLPLQGSIDSTVEE